MKKEERGQEMMSWLKWDNRRVIIIWLKRAEDNVISEKFLVCVQFDRGLQVD
jgi:hypothetical protein